MPWVHVTYLLVANANANVVMKWWMYAYVVGLWTRWKLYKRCGEFWDMTSTNWRYYAKRSMRKCLRYTDYNIYHILVCIQIYQIGVSFPPRVSEGGGVYAGTSWSQANDSIGGPVVWSSRQKIQKSICAIFEVWIVPDCCDPNDRFLISNAMHFIFFHSVNFPLVPNWLSQVKILVMSAVMPWLSIRIIFRVRWHKLHIGIV